MLDLLTLFSLIKTPTFVSIHTMMLIREVRAVRVPITLVLICSAHETGTIQFIGHIVAVNLPITPLLWKIAFV